MNKSLIIMALLGVISAQQIPEIEAVVAPVEVEQTEVALDTTGDMEHHKPHWGPKKMWCKKHPKECAEWKKKKEWCKKNPVECAAWKKKMWEKKKEWCKKNPKECKEAWEKMMEKKKEWCKKNPKDCAAWEKKMMEKKKKWCAENPKECAAIKKEWCEKMPTSAWCKKADDEDVTIKRKLQELTEEEPEMYEEEMPEDSEDFEDFEGSDSDSNSEEPEDEGQDFDQEEPEDEGEDFDHEEHMRGMRNHGQHIMERFQWGTQKILGGDDNQMMKHGKNFLKIKDGFKGMKKMFGGDDHDFKPHFKMPMLGGDDHDYKAAEMMEKREEHPTVEYGEDGH